MLTISGMHKGETKLTIPNQVVREQLFAYILDTYHENDLTFDRYEKRKLASGLAYGGKWKPYFEYIAGACTVMPRSGTSRKVNILFMVLLLP